MCMTWPENMLDNFGRIENPETLESLGTPYTKHTIIIQHRTHKKRNIGLKWKSWDE